MNAALDDLLLLTLTPGLGPTRIGRAIAGLGGPSAVVQASERDLASIEGFGPGLAASIRRAIDDTRSSRLLEQELALVAEHGVTLLAPGDPRYPKLLAMIPDAPPLLYVRGELTREDSLALAIVGSRRCSHYGREQADRFAAGCAQLGLCIVSGGALGVDSSAHRGALRAGGRTIAVIGSGLAKLYPPSNMAMFEQIVQQGAVISELPMRTAPRPENFPARNRIISGLALGTLVIEAARRSGALITARLAAEEHGREVMALPGRVDSATSAGCHHILREGWGALVTSPTEVLQSLGEAGRALLEGAGEAGETPQPALADAPLAKLSDTQRTVYNAICGPTSLDDLAAITGLPASRLQSDLTMLEIRGLIRREAGMFLRHKPA